MEQLVNDCAIPGVLDFHETTGGLIRGLIHTSACTGEVFLQGAHLTRWQPAGEEPVLFLSERSLFQPGKAIRGGVPIIFPWFGSRSASKYNNRTDGPSHGFARTTNWQIESATINGERLELVFKLGPSAESRSLGYDDFTVHYTVSLGAELNLRLEVMNQSSNAIQFEEALHSYFRVGDVQQIAIEGLSNGEFIDKTDGFKRKVQTEPRLVLKDETDRPYLNSHNDVVFNDPVLKRRISILKQNSGTTVVWNPWSVSCAKLADMEIDGWRRMICIETANVMDNAIVLEPGETHVMTVAVRVDSLE